MHPYRLPLTLNAAASALMLSGGSPAFGAAAADDLVPQTPVAFLPGGMLGIQLGISWRQSKQNPSLHQLNCQAAKVTSDFDEVCFFRTSSASRVGGAEIHNDVVHALQSQINSAFQHTGDNVLFVKLPARRMSAEELEGYSKKAPVLLVQLEAKSNELAVLYGYLAPVNAFGTLTPD